MADKVKAVPKCFRTVNAYLTVDAGARALEFYRKAFNAKEVARMMYPDGQKLAHAEVKIGNTIVMISDEWPEGGPAWGRVPAAWRIARRTRFLASGSL